MECNNKPPIIRSLLEKASERADDASAMIAANTAALEASRQVTTRIDRVLAQSEAKSEIYTAILRHSGILID